MQLRRRYSPSVRHSSYPPTQNWPPPDRVSKRPVARTRRAHEDDASSEDGDGETGIEINPPEKDPPPVGSVVEVNVAADMAAEASQIGIHICIIAEYEDDGDMMSRNQDSQVMNIFLEDYEWKQVRKCGECGDFGGRKGSCGHCGVLRPAGVIASCKKRWGMLL